MPRAGQMTVIYTIADADKFNIEEWPRIHAMFSPGPHDGKPYRIHGMSADDEMHRVSLIEEALGRDDIDPLETIREIIQCPDLSKWSWEPT